MNRGFIKGFSGSWGSGLGYLTIEDSETGMLESVPCDNGPTIRALESCFGNVIGDNHCVSDSPGFENMEVYWDYDEFGLTLEGFTPIE